MAGSNTLKRDNQENVGPLRRMFRVDMILNGRRTYMASYLKGGSTTQRKSLTSLSTLITLIL